MLSAATVREVLGKHMLTEGLDLVVDLDQSEGSWLVDKVTGDRYLDFFAMYASMAVGYNHPRIVAARDRLGALAVQKPSNSDAYTETMAEFVETFSATGIPEYLPHAFFVEGGALAVENALKTAFDWKVRKNFEKGLKKEAGSKVIHFQQAFHGRSGYTLSLTNTHDPRKTKYFPKFHWPRITNPKISFPLLPPDLAKLEALEQKAVEEIKQAISADGDDIAALIIEPIQGEGGDNHFRQEFLQALRRICDENEIIFIMDEVQTGIGLTGKFWAHEHFNVRPDILSFGKKSQVCGILASRRIDEVERHVFREGSRISSTFGGNLIDMARFSLILRIIDEERLVENARIQGNLLLSQIEELAETFPNLISNPRGRGLMCAFDLPDQKSRDRFRENLFREKILILGCGEKSIRFRPHLNVTSDQIMQGMEVLARVLKRNG
jgi:L-lysine 6-transaminase